MTTNTQSRLSGALFLSAAQAIVLFLGFITHPIIGHLLGASAYGVFNVVLSVQSIFGLFLTLGVPIAIARFVAQDQAHAQSILHQGLRIQLVIATGMAAVVGLGSPFIAALLNDAALSSLIAFTGVIIFAQAFYPIYAQFLSGMHQFNKQAALTSLYAIAKLAGSLSLLYIFHVYGALGGFALGGLAAALVGWRWTKRSGGRKVRQLPLKSFLSFASLYVLIMVGLQILISLDLFMVKALLVDNRLAGHYSASITLSRISYLLLQGLGFVLLPSVAALTQPGHSHRAAATFISKSIRYLIALIVPGVALAAATSKPLIMLFFPPEYTPAAPSLTILMVGIGALGFYLLLSNIVSGAGKPQVSLYIIISLIAVSGLLGYVLIPDFGLIGAALQTTITGLLGLGAISAYTFYKFAIPIPLRSTINILIASAAAVSITYLWKATAITLIPQYIVVAAIYVAVLILLREVTTEDRQRLAALHPRLKWLAP